jgi:hypothetical protein
MILPGDHDDPPPAPALVIFTDGTRPWWLRLLRPGFRHVLIALARPGHWVIVNPLSHRATVDLVPGEDGAALAAWFRAQGHTVVETVTRRPPRREAPWAPFTCVEVVKRLLGLHARWVLTPHALYQALQPARRSSGRAAPPATSPAPAPDRRGQTQNTSTRICGARMRSTITSG